MAYDPARNFNNPDFDRSEWELFLSHIKMTGAGATFFYIGEGIETMDYTINTETTEKATIAQRLPKVTNKDGGITFPAAFELTKGQPAYDAIVSAGLLGLVNEEFDFLAVYGNIGVKESGTLIADAPFAQKGKAKVSISALGGAGTEKIVVTAEIRTTGDIQRGYVLLEDGSSSPNYDPDERTWKSTAFVAKTDLGVDSLVIGAAAA